MDQRGILRDKLDAALTLATMAEGHAAHEEVVTVLGDLCRLIETAQSARETAVRVLRAEGFTWEVIGDALGISRQGAQKTYGP